MIHIFAETPGLGSLYQWGEEWTTDGTHRWHECVSTEGICDITENSQKDGYSKNKSGGGSKKPSYPISNTASENGTVTLSKTSVKAGDTVTFTVKAEEGFELKDLAVKDAGGKEVELKDLGGGMFSFVMPKGKISVDVEFDKVEETKPGQSESTVIALVIGNASATVNGEIVENDTAPVTVKQYPKTLVNRHFCIKKLNTHLIRIVTK